MPQVSQKVIPFSNMVIDVDSTSLTFRKTLPLFRFSRKPKQAPYV
jgi:hypothetical protein